MCREKEWLIFTCSIFHIIYHTFCNCSFNFFSLSQVVFITVLISFWDSEKQTQRKIKYLQIVLGAMKDTSRSWHEQEKTRRGWWGWPPEGVIMRLMTARGCGQVGGDSRALEIQRASPGAGKSCKRSREALQMGQRRAEWSALLISSGAPFNYRHHPQCQPTAQPHTGVQQKHSLKTRHHLPNTNAPRLTPQSTCFGYHQALRKSTWHFIWRQRAIFRSKGQTHKGTEIWRSWTTWQLREMHPRFW